MFEIENYQSDTICHHIENMMIDLFNAVKCIRNRNILYKIRMCIHSYNTLFPITKGRPLLYKC